MNRVAMRLRDALLRVPAREATFARRGFRRGDPHIVAHLERIATTFLTGYNRAIKRADPECLRTTLDGIPAADLGFAIEGAAMAFALLDQLTVSRRNRNRFHRFLMGGAADHPYMAHVGAGWVLGRLQLGRVTSLRDRALSRMDPLLAWLAVDGYGFHEGFFHPRRTLVRQWQPPSAGSYVPHAFDQGVGRSLWFSECSDARRIDATIRRFPECRQADLWSGVGLACAYAGGADDAAIAAIGRLGSAYLPQIAQGAAFAAKTRLRAGNVVDHTERACRLLCGTDVSGAAAVTDRCLSGLKDTRQWPAFEQWRRRIAQHFATSAKSQLTA